MLHTYIKRVSNRTIRIVVECPMLILRSDLMRAGKWYTSVYLPCTEKERTHAYSLANKGRVEQKAD